MEPLLTVEIYGTRKINVLVIFLLPIHSQPPPFFSVSQEADHSGLHQLLLLSYGAFLNLTDGSSARDHREKRAQSISFLLFVAFSYSLLEIAESISNYRGYSSCMAPSVTSSKPHILSNLWMIEASHCCQYLHASSFLVGSFNVACSSVNSLFVESPGKKVLFPCRTLIKRVGDIIV